MKLLSLIRMELYRVIFSYGFLMSIAGTFLIFLFGLPGMISSNISSIAVFNNVYKYNNISSFLFILATFTCSTSFYMDCKNNLINMIVIRGKPKNYLIAKVITANFIGGMGVVIGTILFIIFICLKQPCIQPSEVEITAEFAPQAFGEFLVMDEPFMFFFLYLLIIYLHTSFWSVLGLCISSFVQKKYMVYFGPFIIAFILNQLMNAVDLPIWINPVKMATVPIVSVSWKKIIVFDMLLYIFLIAVCDLIFFVNSSRRICDGQQSI